MLEIRFLGKVTFVCGGADITEKLGSKTEALAALLLQQKKPIRRERIIDYLWPDSSEEAAKYNLRYNLWQLKKNIGLDEAGEQFLIIDKDTCGINYRYNFRCDLLTVTEFDPEKEHDINRLEELREIHAGEFFEGYYFNGCDDFNELILLERNNLENRRVRVLKRLAALYEEAGSYSVCLEILTEILSLEPYDETTALKTMSVCAASGDRVGAIRYYKNFCSKLTGNLGIQPSEELRKKYSEIKTAGACEIREKPEELETWCLKDADYFWMAEVVEAIISCGVPEDKSILGEAELADLSYIAPRLAAYCGISFNPSAAVPEVRIVRSFLHLLEGVSGRRGLRLRIRRAADMDRRSLCVLQFIRERRIEGLELQTERS